MSDFRYEIKLRYLLSDLKILTQKIRVGPYATNSKLILVDPVADDEEILVHRLILQTTDNAI